MAAIPRRRRGSSLQTVNEQVSSVPDRTRKFKKYNVTTCMDATHIPRLIRLTMTPNKPDQDQSARGEGEGSSRGFAAHAHARRAERLEHWRERMAKQSADVGDILEEEWGREIDHCCSQTLAGGTLDPTVIVWLRKEPIGVATRSYQQDTGYLQGIASGSFLATSADSPSYQWSVEFSVNASIARAKNDTSTLTLDLEWKAVMGGEEAGDTVTVNSGDFQGGVDLGDSDSDSDVTVIA